MSDFYRFPAMAKLDEQTNSQQMERIKDEVREASYEELNLYAVRGSGNKAGEGDARRDYGMELMDVIHTCETALRIEFEDGEIDGLQSAVVEKNRKRGYYGD